MSEEAMNHELLMQKKAISFFKEKIKVHVTFKKDKYWENGTITREPGDDFFYLEYLPEGQRKNGFKGDFVFYLEILDIEALRDERN